MIVILLNGSPRSGKDTFADVALKEYDGIKHSTIDECKEFAVNMGWDGEKDDISREMLSELKKFYIKYFDGPFRDLTWKIKWQRQNDTKVFFTFSREGAEIQRVKDWCISNEMPFYYIFVTGGDSKEKYGNASDDNVSDGPKPDYIIFNEWGNKDKYKGIILDTMKEIFKNTKKKHK